MDLNLGSRLYHWQRDKLLETLGQMLRDAYISGVEDAKNRVFEPPKLHAFAPELLTLGISVHQPAPAPRTTFSEAEPE